MKKKTKTKKKNKTQNAAVIACTAKEGVCVDGCGEVQGDAGGKVEGGQWAGWRTVAFLRVVSLFVCLLARFSFVFSLFPIVKEEF